MLGTRQAMKGAIIPSPMKILPLMIGILSASGAISGDSAPAPASEEIEGITAVASKASKDYIRSRLPDGSFRPEFYSFGEGGKWAGELNDASIDKLHFIDVAKVIAAPLAGRGYLPARDPNATSLLIMVYWGTTAVPAPTSDSYAYNKFAAAQDFLSRAVNSHYEGGNPGLINAADDQFSASMLLLNMENRQRDRIDYSNAQMLGYDAPGLIGTEQGSFVRGTALGEEREDLVSEIEENRYFVVLLAYDFQLMWKQKKHKLLWETRFSISERRNAFDKALPAMARYASKYFGEDSNGLLRERVQEGHVEIGDVKSLGEVDGPRK
jgi:hypothetical protein